MKKRFLSLLLAFCMVLTMLPAAAFAAGDGSSRSPFVVYRNPDLDPAGASLPGLNENAFKDAAGFSARSSTKTTWKNQIIEYAKNSTSIDWRTENKESAYDVKYAVETLGGNYYSITGNTIPSLFGLAGNFFGWDAVNATGECWERSVQIWSRYAALTNNFNVLVKSYVTVNWDRNGERTDDEIITDKIVLSGYNGTPTSYLPNHDEQAKAYAASMSAADPQYSWEFTGWSPEVPTYAIDVDNAAEVDGKTYTAQYKKTLKTYPVTWKNADGTVLETDENVPYGETPTYNGETPTKAATAQYSYTFNGWSPEVGPVTGKTVYTAVFSETVNEYTITWKNEDGTVLETDENVPYGTNPTYNGATPTKDPTAQYTYTFKGWSPEVVSVTGDAEYTAVFSETLNKYTITWKNDVDAPALETDEGVPYGTIPTYNGPTPTPQTSDNAGKAFAGWSPEVGPVTGDRTYTAQYATTTYTVTFDSQGGSDVAPQPVAKDGKAFEPNAPTKAGYRFDGWYTGTTAADGKYNFNTDVTADITLYARWVEQVTVTFNSQGGSDVAPQTIDVDGKAKEPAAPTRDKYRFDGWYTGTKAEDGAVTLVGKYDFNTAVNDDITLYAKWVEQITVKFVKGEDATWKDATVPEEQNIDVGTPAKPPQSPEKANYVFGGWYTDNTYSKEFTFTEGLKYTEDTTLYAKWTELVTVKFVANGGEGYIDDKTNLALGAAVSLPFPGDEGFNITRTGYNFLGWDEDQNATEPAYKKGIGFTAKSTTLYAVWELIPATSTYIVANDVEFTYDSLDEAQLKEKIAAKVMATVKEGETEEVVGAVVALDDVYADKPVGVYTAKLTYEGTEPGTNPRYARAEKEVTITVTKAKATVWVKSQAGKYPYTVTNPIEANCPTIDVLAGIDASSESKLMGVAQVAMPDNMLFAMALACEKLGINPNDISLSDIEKLLKAIEGGSGFDLIDKMVKEIFAYKDALKKLVGALQAVQTALPVDSELKISLKSALDYPENIGVYLVAAISADPNYTTELDAGYIIISPNGVKSILEWNEVDDNYILTKDKQAGFDFGASASVIEATIEGAKELEGVVEDHITYLYIGVDADGNLVITTCPETEPNKVNSVGRGLEVGAYAQIAGVTNWGNEMYYADPIVRPLVITPNVANVTIHDKRDGSENYDQVFTYDGAPKPVDVKVGGILATDAAGKPTMSGLKIKYVGSDLAGRAYESADAPTNAGVYTVIAVYAEPDASGIQGDVADIDPDTIVSGAASNMTAAASKDKLGAAVGVVVIEPADAEVGLDDATYCYDGNQHFAKITNGNLDYVTIAVDRDDNIAYVNLPADTSEHVSRLAEILPAGVEDEVKAFYAKYSKGTVNTKDVKDELNELLDKIIAADASGIAEDKAKEFAEEVIDELKSNADVKALVDKIKSQLKTIKDKLADAKDEVSSQIPDEIEAKVIEYIKAMITKVENGEAVDVDQIKSDLKDLIDGLKSELPEKAVEELEELIDDFIAKFEQNVDVDAIVAKITDMADKLDAETLAKAIAGAIYSAADLSELEAMIETAAAKVLARGYHEYILALTKSIADIYGGSVDFSEVEDAINESADNFVKEAEEKIAALEKKIKDGTLTKEDLEEIEKILPWMETEVDKILGSLKSLVNQIPEGTVIFGQNPSKIGKYDCYAINVSANYKAEFVEATLTIKDCSTRPGGGGGGKPVIVPIIIEKPPKTGDHSTLTICMVLIAAAVMVAVMPAFGRKRRNTK